MVLFIASALIVFVACWVYVGGYIVDMVIWIISKLTPDTANETNLAYIIGGGSCVVGMVVGLSMADSDSGPIVGGFIAGVGMYIAVRLPSKIRVKRFVKDMNALELDETSQESHSMPNGQSVGFRQDHVSTPSVRDRELEVGSAPTSESSPRSEWVATTTASAQPEQLDLVPAPPARPQIESLDPACTPADLCEMASARPDLWDAIRHHPNCYPDLATWIGEQSDPATA